MRDDGLSEVSRRIDGMSLDGTLLRPLLCVAFGGFLEIYELALTGILAPLLVGAGLFRDAHGLLGLPDVATFASVTFAGMAAGVLACAVIVDRTGRRPVLLLAPLLYGSATLAMAFQGDAASLCLCRFVAAIGVGMDIVAADVFLAELAPSGARGRAFAIGKAVQYAAVPVATALAALLAGTRPAGADSWRLMLIVPVAGAIAVVLLRRTLPESPRWLAASGRLTAADHAVRVWKDSRRHRTAGRTGLPMRRPVDHETWDATPRSTLLRRVAMLIVVGGASTIAYYGFANWLPTMIHGRGVSVTKSLAYVALIACAYPLTPLVQTLFADRIERKWQVAIGAAAVAGFGLAFAGQSTAAGWIAFGLLVAVGNNVMATASHTYRSEIFPTRTRGRAVGIIYACDRLVGAASSYLIGWLLLHCGFSAVLMTISGSAGLVIVVVGHFGPSSRGTPSERIGLRRDRAGNLTSD